MITTPAGSSGLAVHPPAARPVGSRQRARQAGYLALALSDAAAILLGFAGASLYNGGGWLEPGGVNLSVAMLIVYMLFAINQGTFSIQVLQSVAESVRRALVSLAVAALVVVLVSFLTQSGTLFSRVAFSGAVFLSALGIGIGRAITDRIYIASLDGKLIDILLITDREGSIDTADRRNLVVLNTARSGISPDLANPQMLNRIAESVRNFDRVIVECDDEARPYWSTILKATHVQGEIVLKGRDRLGAIGVGEFEDNDTIIVARGPLSLANRVKKRGFDLAVAMPVILFLAPLLALVALAIKIDSRGPVLFRQKRVGQSNATFEILKFRSMCTDRSDAAGAQSAAREDDRVTRVGRFIRATSIDELPQLFNVVRGNMSIVGPRPHALGSLAGDQLFWEVNDKYWMRHALKPGITGLAQIRGQRGATHKREDLEARLRSDLEYLNGWRLSRDVAILLSTARVLIHPNAY